MEAFNYLSVFVSIILGLGVTRVLSGIGTTLEHRGPHAVHGPSLAWALTLLLAHVQTWWTLFDMRERADWQFAQFLVLLLQPILLFLLATLVLPDGRDGQFDARAGFERNRRWFFGLWLALLAGSIAKELMFTGGLPSPGNLAFHIVLALVSIVGIATRNATWHRIAAYGSAVLVVLYIALLFSRLQ